MSSYSGEIGLIYRTPYCASKFAVTGFFESLRMEVGDTVDITIICPITVDTKLRDHSLLNHRKPQEENDDSKKFPDRLISVKDAVDVIMDSSDKRARKVLFPTKAWYGYYVRPLFPDYVDRSLKKRALL